MGNVDITELLEKVYTKLDVFDFGRIKEQKLAEAYRKLEQAMRYGLITDQFTGGIQQANFYTLLDSVETNTTPYLRTAGIFRKRTELVLPYFYRRFQLDGIDYDEDGRTLNIKITKLRRPTPDDLMELITISPGEYRYKVTEYIRDARSAVVKLPEGTNKVKVDLSFAPNCWS